MQLIHNFEKLAKIFTRQVQLLVRDFDLSLDENESFQLQTFSDSIICVIAFNWTILYHLLLHRYFRYYDEEFFPFTVSTFMQQTLLFSHCVEQLSGRLT